MSPLAVQSPYAAPDVQELIDWVPRHSKLGTRGPSAIPDCPFMPLPDLEIYLKSDRRTSRLLRALYSGREYSVVVETVEKWYIRAFTILILIGKGEYIEHFTRHSNLRDGPPPFLEKPTHFPVDPSDPHFWAKFYKEQFKFYAHNFRRNDNLIVDDAYVLPIVVKELLGTGGSAAIYRIELHPFYDELGIAAGKSDVSPLAYQLGAPANVKQKPAQGRRPGNTYVLKTYNTSDAKHYYENEVEAFKKIAIKDGQDKSIVQFLGSYKQGDTYNILLEYADRLTLEHFFQDVAPPTLGKDITIFWQRLFNLLKALSCIHTIERPDGLTGPDILIGWHQDVKPSNILVLSGASDHPYDVHFKLADLGLSHFKRTEKLSKSIVDSDVGGTKDYGAPECYRSDDFIARTKVEVKPRVDIWSLGAIYSEAAVWVVLGKAGLTKYRNQRQQEVVGKDTAQDGRPFHDGQNTLTTVEQMHERLLVEEGEVRPGDYVTKHVLKDLVYSMLVDDPPDGRDNAIVLWKKSQKCVEKGQKQLKKRQSPPVANHVVSLSQAFHQRAPEKSSEVSYRDAEQLSGTSHVQEPPPFDPRYSSNLQTNGRSFPMQQSLKRRSDTWHDPSSTRGIESGLHSMDFSSRISPRQLARAGSTLDNYTVNQEIMNTRKTIAEEATDEADREMWQGAHPFESDTVPPHSPGVSTPPESRTSPKLHFNRQMRNGTGLETVHLQGIQESGPFEPPPNFDAPFPSRGAMLSQPMLENASSEDETRRSPPHTSSSRPQASEAKPEKPSLSFAEAKKIREKRARLSYEAQQLLNQLKDRDHVFLIDDSLSMRQHWDNVIDLFSVFAWHTKSLDSNGLEMYFTVSKKKETFKDTTSAVRLLESMSQRVPSTIDLRLDQILRKYQADLERQKERKSKNSFWSNHKDVKPLSLYVFTDGAWEGCDAVAPIEAMIEKQTELKLPRTQVGIQFIRFGEDPRGKVKLQYLDSGLRKKHGKEHDIVDSEPFVNGNVLKMFLAPVFNWYDDDDDDTKESG